MKRNGPEPIISVMAVFGSVLAMRSGIMNGTLLSIFASASMTKPIGCLSTSLNGLGVHGVERGGVAHQRLTHAVLGTPATQRCDAIRGRHRRTVVPLEAVAQREGVGELVVAHRPCVDHLRLGLVVRIEREQRVPDHVGVVAGDVGGGPDRIERAQVSDRNRSDHDFLLRQRGLAETDREQRGHGRKTEQPAAFHGFSPHLARPRNIR